MMPVSINEIDVVTQFASGTLAIAGLIQWLSGDHGKQDDADVIECHQAVMDMLSNADSNTVIEAINDRNLRDQLTVEQIETLQQEIKLAQMGRDRH